MRLCVKCLAWTPSLGKPAAVLLGDSSSPVEGPMWRGTETPSQQPAPACWPCERASLDTDLPSEPNLQASGLHPPERPRASTSQPGQTQTHGPQKLCDVINNIGISSQGSVNFLCKTSDSKYLSLWAMSSLSQLPRHCSAESAIGNA